MRGNLFGVAGRATSGVEVSFTDAGAQARDGDTAWVVPFDRARLSLGGTDGEMLVLEAVMPEGTLSLYVPLSGALQELPATAPVTVRDELARLAAAQRGQSRRTLTVFLGAMVACVLGGIVVWGLVDRALARAVEAIPVSWEAGLGQASLAARQATADVVADPRVLGPVQAIVKRLAVNLPDTPYTFSVQVWRSSEVNAFALPGGPVVVYTGLLERAGGADEVAGVLAHELQHVVLRHSLRALAASLKWSLALTLLMGDTEGLRETLLQQAGRMAILSYSRDAEREADRGAVDLLIRAGLEPVAMARFFATLASQSGGSAADRLVFLSTHPGHTERVATVNALAAERGQYRRVPLDVDWSALRGALGRP